MAVVVEVMEAVDLDPADITALVGIPEIEAEAGVAPGNTIPHSPTAVCSTNYRCCFSL